MDCVKTGIETRKLLLKSCSHIRPFIPETVDGRSWGEFDTDVIADDLRFFNFVPGERWHAFEGYAENQYFVDPCKLLLTTPGINAKTGNYDAFGVPATILANYLRENNIVPEKCDLNSIFFLLISAESMAKMQHLVAQIARFEQLLEQDAPLEVVLPSVYHANKTRYQGYSIRQLCQETHDMYVKFNVKQLQKEMFRKAHFPEVSMLPQAANIEFVRGNVELVAVDQIEGRIAAEGARPYLPGEGCVLFRGKFGVVLFSSISLRWKKVSTCSRDSHRNCRVCISAAMKMVVSGHTAM